MEKRNLLKAKVTKQRIASRSALVLWSMTLLFLLATFGQSQIAQVTAQTDQSWLTYSNQQFGFAFLYQPSLHYKEWQPTSDLLNSTSFYDKNSTASDEHPPEIAVTVFDNASKLSLADWVKLHANPNLAKLPQELTNSVALFTDATQGQALTIDTKPALIFAQLTSDLTIVRLVIEHGSKIISISYVDFGKAEMRDFFTTIVASFKFDSAPTKLAVDTNLSNLISKLANSYPSPTKQPIKTSPTPQAAIGYKLPWVNGVAFPVTQGWNSSYSHTCPGQSCYAYDFGLPEGTEVRAARGGIVTDATGQYSACGGSEYANTANRVTIKHDDGTATLYLHLRQVDIAQNSTVSQGTRIGLSGKVGWTGCGPHLHFQRQAQGIWITNSQPVYFDEYVDQQLSVGPYYISQNGSNNRSPEGFFDEINSVYLRGWAWDPDKPNVPIDVHVYKDGDLLTGSFVGVYKADLFRDDVKNATGDNGYHGFEIFLPDSIGDGGTHSVYLYAIDAGGAGPNPLLGNSPKTVANAISIGRGSVYQAKYQEAYRQLELSKEGRPGDATNTVKLFGNGSSGVKWQPLTGGVSGNGAIFMQENTIEAPECTRAYALDGGIYTEYMRQGGPDSALGSPTSAVFIEPQSNKWRVAFAKGYITDNGNGTYQTTWYPSSGSNWRREFYNNQCTVGSPAWVDYGESEINFDHNWGNTSSYPAVFYDHNSAIYNRIIFFGGGNYKFTIGSDDGFALYIDGNLVLNKWIERPYTVDMWETTISAGYHNISIHYFESIGPSRLNFNMTLQNPNPRGALDAADCNVIRGWAYDPKTAPNTPIWVHIYDGVAGSGTLVKAVLANSFRVDLPSSTGDNGNHGFSFSTPASLKDGAIHSINVYAINTAGNESNTLLYGSPQNLRCGYRVTQNSDTGDTNTDGTLSYALQNADGGEVISFALSSGDTVAVKSALPALRPGAKIMASCGANGPTIRIDGSGAPTGTVGLLLSGGNVVQGLKISGFSGQLLKMLAPGNNLSCLVLTR